MLLPDLLLHARLLLFLCLCTQDRCLFLCLCIEDCRLFLSFCYKDCCDLLLTFCSEEWLHVVHALPSSVFPSHPELPAGGMIFFNSTRFTLIPHGSVATSREARILVLIVSLDVSVSSKFQITDDITKCGCCQIFNCHDRILYTVCKQLRVCNLEKYNGINPHGYIIFCNNRLWCKINYLLF